MPHVSIRFVQKSAFVSRKG